MVSEVTVRMTNEDDTYNAYNTLPIVKSIKGKLRRQVVLLQVVPDELRNYNVVFVTKEDEEYVSYSFGDNTSGCLGLGHDKPVLEQAVPIKELRGKHVVQIVSGSRFAIARTLYDEVWSWGVNTSLQLAQPEESNHSVFVPTLVLLPFPKSSAIVKVACGHSFGALINRSGSVYTFGDNSFGQLGTGMPETKDELNQIYDLDPICDISCGARHLVMLTSCKKKVYVCGDNQLSQLGIPNLNEVTVKRTATHLPLQLRDDELVKAIACGAAHTLLLLSNGMIFAFGDNRENQLASASSRSSNPGTPHLIPEDEIFEQIFTVNLSNISVAKSASATGFLYIWGPIRDKDAHKQMKDLAKTQGGPRYILRKPRRTYITSVPKLFAIYEPLFLTPSEPLVSAGLRRPSCVSKCFNEKSKGDVHFLLGSHTVYAQKVLLVTYSDYFYRYFDLAPIKTEITRPSSIPICDYSYQVFRGYIHFIYTGALYETSALKEKWSEGEVIKYLVELTELALVYEETDLYELCLQELTSPDSSLMCPQLVTQIYSEAYRYHVAPLMEQCTKFMKTQPNVEMGLRSAENKATEQGNSELANDTSTRAPNEPTNGQRPTAISDTEGTPK